MDRELLLYVPVVFSSIKKLKRVVESMVVINSARNAISEARQTAKARYTRLVNTSPLNSDERSREYL